MPTKPALKPTHKAVKDYYAALESYARQRVKHETALRSAFQNLLEKIGRAYGWSLIPELSGRANAPRGTGFQPVTGGVGVPPASARPDRSIRPDATFRDEFFIVRGHWEAKDSADDLDAEIKKKIKSGYPLTNIIFEDTRTAPRIPHDSRPRRRFESTVPTRSTNKSQAAAICVKRAWSRLRTVV